MLRRGEGLDPRSRRGALAAARERPRNGRVHCLRGWGGEHGSPLRQGCKGSDGLYSFPCGAVAKEVGEREGEVPAALKARRVSCFPSK